MRKKEVGIEVMGGMIPYFLFHMNKEAKQFFYTKFKPHIELSNQDYFPIPTNLSDLSFLLSSSSKDYYHQQLCIMA